MSRPQSLDQGMCPQGAYNLHMFMTDEPVHKWKHVLVSIGITTILSFVPWISVAYPLHARLQVD